MVMIGHKTISPYDHVAATAPFRHLLYVISKIPLIEERLLPTIAVLGYVMRYSWHNYPRNSCPEINITANAYQRQGFRKSQEREGEVEAKPLVPERWMARRLSNQPEVEDARYCRL